jgi:hypothetical protein
MGGLMATRQETKQLYDLELHGTIRTEGWVITRVPGGWIYESAVITHKIIFVPLNKEFVQN